MIFLTAGNVARFRQFFSFAEKRRKGAERAESRLTFPAALVTMRVNCLSPRGGLLPQAPVHPNEQF